MAAEIIGVSDSGVRVWDPHPRTQVAEGRDHYPGVNGIAVCPAGGRTPVIAIETDDGVWWVDAATGAPSYPRVDPQTIWAVAPAVMPDGSVQLFGAAHYEPYPVLCWDAATGAPVRSLSFHDISIKSVATIPLAGGPLIAAGDDSGEIRRWDALTGAEAGPAIITDETNVVTALTSIALPDGRALVAANGSAGRLSRWDARTGEPIGMPIAADSSRVYGLIGPISAGRPQLISSGHDEVLRRWDAVIGELLDEPMAGLYSALFTSGGVTMLAAADGDGTIAMRPLLTR